MPAHDPKKPLMGCTLKIRLTLSNKEEWVQLYQIFPKEELEGISLASLGSSLQRLVYEMLERAITELEQKMVDN